MKTQINQLLSGSRTQVLNPNRDYTKLPQQSTEGRHSGSSASERAEVWRKVTSENIDGLYIDLDGLKLMLPRNISVSGKTITYSTYIMREQAQQILGGFFPKFSKGDNYNLVISESDVVVWISKKSYVTLCPSLITIL